jgi:calcineurin-like phosphoesterase family protein
MSATYFTSDLHIGHRLVAGIRGFSSGDGDEKVYDLQGHSDAIIKAWSVVQPDDIVWVLGDICISARTWAQALELLAALPGRKRLIGGNHDPVSSIHRDAWKYQRGALEVFESAQDFARVKLAGRQVLLSHYPYAGLGSEGTDDVTGEPRSVERYTQYRLTDTGDPLIHGHTHGKEKFHLSAAGTPEIHVGMDAWGMRLVPGHEVERLLEAHFS